MLKFLFKGALLISALGLEIFSMMSVINENLTGIDLFTALLLHISACAVAALVIPSLLSTSYTTSKLATGLLLFIIALFIPLLGMSGLMLALIPGLRIIKKASELPMNSNLIRTFSEGSVNNVIAFNYGKVNLASLLQSNNPDIRLNAVYATLKLEDKNAIPLLRIALRDPVDDIRLLAYALIDRKEQRISERIESVRQKLEANETPPNARHLYRSIVKDYWEMAHLGLVEGETLNYVLNKTREYLERGLQRYPKDRGLHFQYAKLLLKLKKLKSAHDEFKIAENLGIERKQLLLYYAEIDFLQRRYGEVKRYMKEIDFSTARPDIYAAKRFWADEEVH